MIKNNKKSFLAAVLSIVTFILISCFFSLLNDSTELAITPSNQDIKYHHSYFVSLDDSATISGAIASNDFIPVTENRVPVDFGTQAYWHKYQVSNQTSNNKQLTLFFDNYVIAEIDIYVTASEKVIDTVHLGNSRWQSELEKFVLPNHSFILPSQSDITLYIRSQSKGSANLPLVLFHTTDFNNYKLFMYMLWGIFVGLVFIMAVYNLILFMGVKDIVYLFYIGYVLSILTEMGMLHGFIVFLLPKSIVSFLILHITAIHYFIVFFGLLFALKFLKFDEDKNSIFKIGKAIAGLLIPFSISTVWMREFEAVQIYFVIQGMVYLFILGLLVIKFRDNFSWAKYYFISWLPLYIGGAITPLFFVGTLAYSFWIRNALLVSIMIEAALMAMALANRLRSSEEDLLFNITHDQASGLANDSLMTKVLNEEFQNKRGKSEYAIMVAEIKHYHAFSPYLKADQLKNLIHQVSLTIEEQLSDLPLINIGKKSSEIAHTFIVKDGFIGLAIKHPNLSKLHNQLSSLDKLFPISMAFNEINLSINCVFGLALSSDGKHPVAVANKALRAINIAKQHSKIYAQYNATLIESDKQKMALAAALQKAIEQEKLELYFQPQVLIENQTPYGCEALLRWNHPELGFIPPDEFIKIAEDTGMIHQITRWVIRNALQHQDLLKKSGFELAMSINISTLDVVNDDLCKYIINTVSTSDIPPQQIILEVTETAGIYDQERFIENLSMLSSVGCQIAIDDFGTGYSSLSYLSDYSVHKLKIDKMFITDLNESQKNNLIVKATLSMAKSLDVKVVAEGIETSEVAERLKQYRCDIGQGYYFARPMPFADYLAWLNSHQ